MKKFMSIMLLVVMVLTSVLTINPTVAEAGNVKITGKTKCVNIPKKQTKDGKLAKLTYIDTGTDGGRHQKTDFSY